MRLGMLSATGKKHMNSWTFPTSSDFLTKASAVTSSSGQVLLSCWFRADSEFYNSYNICESDASTGPPLFAASLGMSYYDGSHSNYRCNFTVQNNPPTGLTGIDGNTSPLTKAAAKDGKWHHGMFSMDYNHAAGSQLGSIYIDGVSAGTVAGSGAAITYWNVKKLFPFNGFGAASFAQLYLTDTYLDLTNSSNRAKFYNAGRAVNLGANGSTPTGTQPLIYINNPIASIGTNVGSGGNFTVSGSPVDCNTSPSF